MKMLFRSLLFLALTYPATGAFSQPAPLWMRLSQAPMIVVTGGQPTAYFEYFVTNTSTDTLYLKKLELRQGTASTSVAMLDHAKLITCVRGLNPTAKSDGTVIPPATTGIIYLEPVIEMHQPEEHFVAVLEYERKGRKAPSAFRHSFTVEKKTPLVLGAPLREGPWAAVYDPSWERGHRRVLYKGDSGMHLPGRYAIDFIKLDTLGRYALESEDGISNWYGYGAEVLAVSDGTVLSIRNDFPESATLSAHHQPAANDATGNYIALEIGKGQVVFYEHLKPGSINVQPGQKVTKGDVIAALGFTGQSTGPHLHLHVADRNAPLRAEGIPFVFEHFTVLGAFTDMGKFGKGVWSSVNNASQPVQQERPAPNTVIVFR